LGETFSQEPIIPPVKIIECPRDAWQGLSGKLPAETKADYLRVLIAAGFRHLDAVSFVSPAAVPQMADSELVLSYLDPPGFDPETQQGVEIIGIVVNEKGAERAIATGAVSTLGFPYSISPTFLSRNQNQTPEEALDALEAIGTLAYKSGQNLVAYISMAFGNPYGDPWDIDEVVSACDLLIDNGITQISLADTVGLATPAQIAHITAAVLAIHDTVEIGLHLHSRHEDAPARIRAAYHAGCRRFDSTLGGHGGCPFAQDLLVGNLPTETLLTELRLLGADLPPLHPLDTLLTAANGIAAKFATVQ
jgi:hydroxymethylglutaryl-CoA lyase